MRMQAFDHHSTDFAAGWREQYREIRQTCPVLQAGGHGGFVLLTRYEDIKHVLLAPKDFASGRELEIEGVPGTVAGGVTVPTNPFRMGMMEMDPPESLRLRRILVPWFSARAVEVNAVHIRDMVTWCLDRVIESGRCDIVDDLANPVPALVTLDLMGLPLGNWERYARVLHGAVYREKGSAKELAWLQGDLQAIVEERRSFPSAVTTPLDALLAAEVDGTRLSIGLVVELVYMLLSGGIDTSTALIAHSVRYLSAHPRVAGELRANPELIPGAVDEMLRFYSPGTGIARTAVHDTTLGGVAISAGERLFMGTGAANTDPAEFDDPGTLDVRREAGRHLAFGAGIHRCLGSFLAPREMAILLTEVLTRLPDLRVDEAGVRSYETIPLVGGFRAMPATFTPGPKAGRFATHGLPPGRGERDRVRAAQAAGEESKEASAVAGSTGLT
jgi:cytochrome P450